MRDPARISRIVEKLARAWEAAPDMRLGQLCNCMVIKSKQDTYEFTFNTEDDAFERALDKWLNDPPLYSFPKK